MLYLSCENNLEGRCLVVITGKVKWFNNEKGYGFIEYKDTEDIFVHYSSILSEGYKTLVEGQYVKFDLVRTDKGLHFLPFFCYKASFIFKKQKFYELFSKKSQKIFTLLLNFLIIVVQCMCKQNLWR